VRAELNGVEPAFLAKDGLNGDALAAARAHGSLRGRVEAERGRIPVQ
jgi:hypothetical protein